MTKTMTNKIIIGIVESNHLHKPIAIKSGVSNNQRPGYSFKAFHILNKPLRCSFLLLRFLESFVTEIQ